MGEIKQNTCSTDTAIAASGAGASSSREYKSLPLEALSHEQFEVSATNLCCASSKSWTPPEIDGSSSGERARCSVQPPVEICQDLSMCSSLPNRLSSWLLELTNIIQYVTKLLHVTTWIWHRSMCRQDLRPGLHSLRLGPAEGKHVQRELLEEKTSVADCHCLAQCPRCPICPTISEPLLDQLLQLMS